MLKVLALHGWCCNSCNMHPSSLLVSAEWHARSTLLRYKMLRHADPRDRAMSHATLLGANEALLLTRRQLHQIQTEHSVAALLLTLAE